MTIKNKPKIVIDTNIIIVSVPRKSKYNWIIQKLLDKDYFLCISNDIITEYQEKLSSIYSPTLAKDFTELLTVSSQVLKIIPYFHWNLIEVDPEDNKFVDCAIAGNTDFIITEDNHFNILKSIDFPLVNTLNLTEFSQLIKTNN